MWISKLLSTLLSLHLILCNIFIHRWQSSFHIILKVTLNHFWYHFPFSGKHPRTNTSLLFWPHSSKNWVEISFEIASEKSQWAKQADALCYKRVFRGVAALISMCGIAISRLILSDPIFAICTADDDEDGCLYVDDGSDSGGDNIFSRRQLIITASLVGS